MIQFCVVSTVSHKCTNTHTCDNKKLTVMCMSCSESRRWVAGPIVKRELEPRSFHAACAVGRKLVIVGGRGLENQHFADVHVFDTGR